MTDYAAPAATFAAIAASLLVAGCAPSSSEPEPVLAVSPERQCFFTRQINGYAEAPDGPNGNERLTVDTGGNERFLLEAQGVCPDLDWSRSIGIDTRFSGTSLCSGDTTRLVVPDSVAGFPDRCTVRVLGKVIED